MHPNETHLLFDKYLSGRATPEEASIVERWLNENSFGPDTWQKIPEESRRALLSGLFTDIKTTIDDKQTSRSKIYSFLSIQTFTAVAAVLLVFIGSVLLLNNNPERSTPPAEKITVVQPGKRHFQILSDGTKVWLNSASTLKLDDNFNLKERRVYLEGEAYFEVAHNNRKPFVVHTGELETKVLGTQFNVSAYKEARDIKVALLSGKVEVFNQEGERAEKLTLKPNDIAVFNKEVQTLQVVSKENTAASAEWKAAIFVFKDTRLSSVISKLEEAYHVKIVLADPDLNRCKITGRFAAGSGIEEILKSIALSIDGKYSITNDEIKLKGLGCSDQ